MAIEFAKRLVEKLSTIDITVETKLREEDIERLSEIFSALSSPGRIRILLALEKRPRRFSELEILSGLRGGSLKNALSKLINVGLISYSSKLYEITDKGKIVLKRIRGLGAYV